MSKTRRDLIDQVLENLGVLASGEAPSDEDLSRIDGFIDPTIAMLSGLKIPVPFDVGEAVAIGGEIEDAMFLPVAACVADQAKAAEGLAGDPSYYVLAQQAQDVLRQLGVSEPKKLHIDPILNRRTRWYAGRF